jgi:hypothetical protein
MTKVEIEAGLNPIRGQVMNISHLLPVGAKYFTIEPKDVDLKFTERKNEIAQNPQSPDLITNRGPRAILVQDHSVLSQEFAFDVEGNKVVIFNKDQADESRANIVTGNTPFGQISDDAMRDALRGESRIFANGMKTVAKADALNQAELDRWVALRNQIERYCDSLRSTIAANKKKAQEYQQAIDKFKPEVDMTDKSGFTVEVTE